MSQDWLLSDVGVVLEACTPAVTMTHTEKTDDRPVRLLILAAWPTYGHMARIDLAARGQAPQSVVLRRIDRPRPKIDARRAAGPWYGHSPKSHSQLAC